MKKKIITDIKAAVVLIIAENLIALRNIVNIIINSVSKSLGVRGRVNTKKKETIILKGAKNVKANCVEYCIGGFAGRS